MEWMDGWMDKEEGQGLMRVVTKHQNIRSFTEVLQVK